MSDVARGAYILIIDRLGSLGYSLSNRFMENGNKVVICSSSYPSPTLGITASLKFLHIKKRIPTIPDLSFSQIFIVLTNEKEIFDALSSVVRKAKRDKSKIVILLYYKNYSIKLKEKLTRLYSNISFLLIGDVLSDETNWEEQVVFEEGTMVQDIVAQAKNKGIIKLREHGTDLMYPVFLKTVVDEIVKNNITYTPLFLFSKFPITTLSLARYIQQTFPFLKIDFIQSKRSTQTFSKLPMDGIFFSETYDFKNEFKKSLKSMIQDIDAKPLPEKNNDRKIKKEEAWFTSGIKTIFFQILIISLSIFILPFFLTSFFVVVGGVSLYSAKDTIEKNNITDAQNAISLSKFSFKTASELSTLVAAQASILGIEEKTRPVFITIDNGVELTIVVESLMNSVEKIKTIQDKKSSKPKEDFLDALNSLRSAHASLQKIDAAPSYIDIKNISQIEKIRKPLGLLVGVSEILPDILGFNGKKQYLVLFQNNMELRPGGGFIGSFGLLTLEDSRVADLTIHNVYDADGQLKGHIEPPFPIRRYLPSEHWYLRDSNFNIDFGKSAEDALFFLEKELQIQADGVIGLDTFFVSEILKITGPIKIPDYDKVITTDNAYQEIQSQAQDNSFAGSTQKKDFLEALFKGIKEKIDAKKDISYSNSSSIFLQMIDQKSVLVYLKEPFIERYFLVNGMSSSLWDNREKKENTVNDYLGVSEANLGVNKVNYYVTRKIEQVVTINDQGEISEKIDVIYKNESPKNDTYKNYIRFITPFGSTLNQVSINKQKAESVPAIIDPLVFEKNNFIKPKELEVEEYVQENKIVFGFLMDVLPKTEKTIGVTYSLENKFNTNKDLLTYDLILFKQPGIKSYSYSFTLSFPKNFKILEVTGVSDFAQTIDEKNNKIQLLHDVSTDRHLSIQLVKK